MRFRAVLLIAFLSVAPAAQAQNIEAWAGVWTLNLSKSVYNPGPAPYGRASMTVEAREDRIHFAYTLVGRRGGVQRMEWTGKFDGMDYMVQGVDDYVTYAYTRIDDRTYEVVTKVDGRVAAVSRVTLSADGRTLTTATGGRNAQGEEITNTTVYEKRSP